jgi:hypothetical protein
VNVALVTGLLLGPMVFATIPVTGALPNHWLQRSSSKSELVFPWPVGMRVKLIFA